MKPDKYIMEFGDYINIERVRLGLSQRRLAILCDLSNTEISRIESGERKYLSVETLIKLSKGMGMPLMELIQEYIKERGLNG